jgi:hypothetical protein
MVVSYLISLYFILGFAAANLLAVLSRSDSHFRFYYTVNTGLDFFFALLGWPVILALPLLGGICTFPIWIFDKWVKILRS